MVIAKLGGAGDRFGDYLSVDCVNLPWVSGHNQLSNTKFRSLVIEGRSWWQRRFKGDSLIVPISLSFCRLRPLAVQNAAVGRPL